MIHYNNDNNAYCSAVNGQNFRQESIIQYKQADVCKTFTSRPFRIPGTAAPNYKNWDKRRTVNSKVLLGLGWATGGRSMFYKHLFLYLLNMLNLKDVIL